MFRACLNFYEIFFFDILNRNGQNVFVNPAVPDDVRNEYIAWLNIITASNTKYPKTSADFGGQYFYFMEKFKQYAGYSNKGNIEYRSSEILKPKKVINNLSTFGLN